MTNKYAQNTIPSKDELIEWITNNPDTTVNIKIYQPLKTYELVSRFIPPHDGVDLGAPIGTPIYGILPGIVTLTQYEGESLNTLGGTCVYTEHNFGPFVFNTYNAHCNSIGSSIVPNKIISPDTQIATVGKTGNAVNSGPHNHFTIKLNGEYVDPLLFFNKAFETKVKYLIPYVDDKTYEFIYFEYLKKKIKTSSNKKWEDLNFITKKANQYYKMTK